MTIPANQPVNSVTQRNPWIDHLRSTLTVMVVAHHAMLAYTGFAVFHSPVYILSTHPVVDATRWKGLDVIVRFNDHFFMALMFWIGGLFLSASIARKGTRYFVRDRVRRLFIPFILLGTLLMLLAYYPAFYLATGQWDLHEYIVDFFTTEAWPVGPPWFLWVLFLFNLGYLLFDPVIRRYREKTRRVFAAFAKRPMLFALAWMGLTWILLVPLDLAVGADTWTGVGPFDFQKSRLLLYGGYFLLGAVIGNTPFNRELFGRDSRIARLYLLWIFLSLAAFTGVIVLPFNSWIAYFTALVISATFTCLAFISFFNRRVNREKRVWVSLAANAYLIYLLHYPVVTWSQFLLLRLNLPAVTKASISFSLALGISWGIAIILRRNSLVARYL